MHADGTWANASVLLFRIGRPGLAVKRHAGLRPIRVHRHTSLLHLRKNSCLLRRLPHRPRKQRHDRARHRIMATRLALHWVFAFRPHCDRCRLAGHAAGPAVRRLPPRCPRTLPLPGGDGATGGASRPGDALALALHLALPGDRSWHAHRALVS